MSGLCKNSSKAAKAAALSYDIVELNSSEVCNSEGVELGPLLLKSQIKPQDVLNARFAVINKPVKSPSSEISEDQYNVKMERLLKCIMAEVEIGKRLRKANVHLHKQQAMVQQIKSMEDLKANYERERFLLMKQLNLKYTVSTPMPVESAQQSFSGAASHSSSMVAYQAPKWAEEMFVSRKSQATPFKAPSTLHQRPVMDRYIVRPTDLRDKIRTRLSFMSRSKTGATNSQGTVKTTTAATKPRSPIISAKPRPKAELPPVPDISEDSRASDNSDAFYDMMEQPESPVPSKASEMTKWQSFTNFSHFSSFQ